MNKVAKIFTAIYETIKSPKLVNRILDDNEVWKSRISKKHSNFFNGFPLVEINELFPNFKETLDVVDFLGGGSTPPDLAIIKALCKSVPGCNYFEIGTWRGESAINASEVCKECYTLNLDPEKSFNGKYRNLFGFFSKNISNIHQLYGDSRTFDFKGLNKKFDVIFIDADHHYEFIKNDTLRVFQSLVHDDSIVIWHDYGKDPATPRYETICAILDGIPLNLQKNLYHISNTICAICTNRKLNSYSLQSPAIPNKKFKVTLEVLPV